MNARRHSVHIYDRPVVGTGSEEGERTPVVTVKPVTSTTPCLFILVSLQLCLLTILGVLFFGVSLKPTFRVSLDLSESTDPVTFIKSAVKASSYLLEQIPKDKNSTSDLFEEVLDFLGQTLFYVPENESRADPSKRDSRWAYESSDIPSGYEGMPTYEETQERGLLRQPNSSARSSVDTNNESSQEKSTGGSSSLLPENLADPQGGSHRFPPEAHSQSRQRGPQSSHPTGRPLGEGDDRTCISGADCRRRRNSPVGESFGIIPEEPGEIVPSVTFSQTSQIMNDLSFGLVYTHFNFSVFRAFELRINYLVMRLAEYSVKIAKFQGYKPHFGHPERRLLETFERRYSLFQAKSDKVRMLYGTMSGVPESDNDLWNKRDFKDDAWLDGYVKDPYLIYLAEAEGDHDVFPTWREFLEVFPLEPCSSGNLECTGRAYRIEELYKLSEAYALRSTPETYSALLDIVETLTGNSLRSDEVVETKGPRKHRGRGRGHSTVPPLPSPAAVQTEPEAWTPKRSVEASSSSQHTELANWSTTESVTNQPVRDDEGRVKISVPGQWVDENGVPISPPIGDDPYSYNPHQLSDEAETVHGKDNHLGYRGEPRETRNTPLAKPLVGGLSLGLRLIGVVLSVFSGLSYLGALSKGSSNEDLQKAIDQDVLVNAESGFSDLDEKDLNKGSYNNVPKSHEEVLRDYIVHAEKGLKNADDYFKSQLKVNSDKNQNLNQYYDIFLKNRVGALYINTLISYTVNVIAALNEYVDYADSLIEGFSVALTGATPLIFFPPDNTYRSLQELDNKKPKNYALIFENEYENLARFYSLKCRILPHDTERGIFTLVVLIPMINLIETYALYKYESAPVVIGPNKLMLEIVPETEFVAADKARSFITPVNAESLTECIRVGTRHLCPDLKLFEKRPSCISSLISGNRDGTYKLCKFKMKKRSGTTVSRFAADKFVFHTDRTKTIVLGCDGKYKGPKTIQITEGTNRVRFPPGCSASIDESFISPVGYLSTGDDRYGDDYLHLPVDDSVKNVLEALEERFPKIDLSEPGRIAIQEQLVDGGDPLDLSDVGTKFVVVRKSRIGPFMSGMAFLLFVIVFTLMIAGALWKRRPPTDQDSFLRSWRPRGSDAQVDLPPMDFPPPSTGGVEGLGIAPPPSPTTGRNSAMTSFQGTPHLTRSDIVVSQRDAMTPVIQELARESSRLQRTLTTDTEEFAPRPDACSTRQDFV